MSIAARLTNPAQIPATIAAVLTFTPADSLVILGLGGGPTARVDLPRTPAELAECVDSARVMEAHWRPGGVLLAVYSDAVSPLDVEHAFAAAMPDVPIRYALTVRPNGDVVDQIGRVWPADRNSPIPELAARTVAPSRAVLVAEAAEVTDPGVAWTLARAAYAAGGGARAWCYLDRFHALAEPTAQSTELLRLLSECVDPASARGRAVMA